MDLKELQALAQAKIAEFGLKGWSFRFGRSKRRLGLCDYRAQCIEIAAYYAYFTPDDAVKDTLLHEIAHALAGPGAGHGPKWRAVAKRIGATPKACDDSPETVVPPGDWQAACGGCGKMHYRYRRPATISGYRCRCEARSPLTFTFRGQPVPESYARPAPWKATCAGCGVTHSRVRRPKAGQWRCGCPKKGELKWAWVSS
ncbi:MAG: SprT family zinc-dependent metalloprotease [Gemmataceae bacterium]